MFNAKQKDRMHGIRVMNVIKENSLLDIAQEEIAEFQLAVAKYKQNDGTKEEVLEEGVDTLITLTNYLEENYRSEDIRAMINKKLSKAESILQINKAFK